VQEWPPGIEPKRVIAHTLEWGNVLITFKVSEDEVKAKDHMRMTEGGKCPNALVMSGAGPFVTESLTGLIDRPNI
jgi:hypothetical protein